jgi:hypothetical protein
MDRRPAVGGDAFAQELPVLAQLDDSGIAHKTFE